MSDRPPLRMYDGSIALFVAAAINGIAPSGQIVTPVLITLLIIVVFWDLMNMERLSRYVSGRIERTHSVYHRWHESRHRRGSAVTWFIYRTNALDGTLLDLRWHWLRKGTFWSCWHLWVHRRHLSSLKSPHGN